MSAPDSDNLKSVRDIASKFEKISDEITQEQPQIIHPAAHFTSSPIDNKIYMIPPQKINMQQLEHPRLYPSLGHRLVSQVPVKEVEPSKIIAKERLNGVNGAKQVYSNQSTSGNVYSPHLTDAQLTNVLRIGTNRSSFRNSNGSTDIVDENFVRFPYVLHESKRPDKPPDYETAIQRLELLRNDRNFTSFYTMNNSLTFEALLEQAKKRRAPKKSVTFSDKVVLVACAGDEDNDFIPNPLLERVYKQHFMQNAQTDVAPSANSELDQKSKPVKDCTGVESSSPPETRHHTQDANHTLGLKASNQLPCHLCHKKTVESPNLYCPDCAFYMSRFQQK